MKKIFLAIGIVVTLMIIGYLIFIFPANPDLPSQENQNGLLPSASVASPSAPLFGSDRFPKTPTITLGTSQGMVTVKNFYNSMVDTEEGFIILADATEYGIGYDPSNANFLIVLNINTSLALQNAEAKFLELLGVGQTDACKLNVQVTFFRTAKDGENSRLSFCFGNVE